MKKILFFVPLVIAGCVSTSQVLEMGKDTYSVTSTADGYRTAAAARESAFLAGSVKCTEMGKRFIFLNESTERTRMGIDTTVSVNFRCLNADDAEYQRPIIRAAPNNIIEVRH